MKKLSLLVALALLVSFGAFAQTVSLGYSVSGDASMIWGVDLDTEVHGFGYGDNSNFDLSVTLDPASYTKSGEGVYGEITLSGFGVAIGSGVGIDFDNALHFELEGADDDTTISDWNTILGTTVDEDTLVLKTGFKVTAPSVAAKIVFSDALFLQIASKPDFDYNEATDIGDTGEVELASDTSGGLKFGYTSDMADANIFVVSQGDKGAATQSDYAAGLDLTIKAIDMLTVRVDVGYNGEYDENIYVGGNIDLAPMDMLSVNIGADVETTPADPNMEFDITIPVKATDALTITTSGSMLQLGAADPIIDAKLVAALSGDFSAGADVTAKNVTGDATMAIDINYNASYKAALSDTTYVKPGVEGGYNMGNVEAENDEEADLKVYVEAGLIANTTFTLEYKSEQLLDTNPGKAMDKGYVTLTTKISY